MSEDGKVVTLSVVSNGKDNEKTKQDQFEESFNWTVDFVEELLEEISNINKSPICSICTVLTHEDGSVTHGHRVLRGRGELVSLIGALEIKKARLINSPQE